MFLLSWALVFLLIALVAGVFGFSGVARDASFIAKILFFIFVVLFIIAIIGGY